MSNINPETTRAYIIPEEDFNVGVTPEAPNHVIITIPKADIAFAFPLDSVQKLHDMICAAIVMLEGKDVEGKDSNEIPTDKNKWN
jgi:hypothetical protein